MGSLDLYWNLDLVGVSAVLLYDDLFPNLENTLTDSL